MIDEEPRSLELPGAAEEAIWGPAAGLAGPAGFLVLAMVIVRFVYLPHTILVTIVREYRGTVHQFLLSLADAHRGHRLDIEPVITAGIWTCCEPGRCRQARLRHRPGRIRHGCLSQYPAGRRPVGRASSISWSSRSITPRSWKTCGICAGADRQPGRRPGRGMYWHRPGILSFAGLAQAIEALNDAEEIGSETDREQLPKPVFISTMPPSELVRRLVVQFGYRLVPLPFGDAFRLTALRGGDTCPCDPTGINTKNTSSTRHGPRRSRTRAARQSAPGPSTTLGCRIILITHRS